MPRSRAWIVFSALFVAFCGVLFLSIVLSGRWGAEGYMHLGLLFFATWQLCDVGGASLYVRRGSEWGRTVRVFGFAVLFPLWMVSYLTYSWFIASNFFWVTALIFGASVAWQVNRAVSVLRRNARGR